MIISDLENLHAKLEYHSFIITRVIVYNAKLGQWILVHLNKGQGQP
jgi:hydrogenase maturation factor